MSSVFFVSYALCCFAASLLEVFFHQSACCLVRLLSFDASSPNIQPNGVNFSYSAVVWCSDATTTKTFFSPVQLLHFSSECCLRNMSCFQNHKKMRCSPAFRVLCSSSRFDQLNLLTWFELNLSPPIYGTCGSLILATTREASLLNNKSAFEQWFLLPF
ncbi:hypothetical protein LINGRAHAP2_LOCUS32001 [Linum grandiflorum]